jgi:prevent-host-death family protein
MMQLMNDIKPITYLKSRAADVLKHINETHRPMIITQNGEAKAVIQDPQSYEDMKNAISLLKLLSFAEEDIKNGNVQSEEDVFRSAEELLKK